MVMPFYNSMRSYLKLSLVGVNPTGNDDLVDVGENFTVTLSLQNIAPHPQIKFLNPRLQVQTTEFAALQGGDDNVVLPFDRDRLNRNEVANITLSMVATDNFKLFGIPGTDAAISEKILRVRPIADVDWAAFGRCYGNWEDFFHDIDPT